jgi:glutamate racemase
MGGENTTPPLRIVITDSGLGGLSICAELERDLRSAAGRRPVELLYFNAWPDPEWGYNDLPDPASRARVLDAALDRMAAEKPDLIVIACNTLSILYDLTEFSRTFSAKVSGDMRPCHRSGTGNHVPQPRSIPVRGIIAEGVRMFEEALAGEPGSGLVLFGTKTTIESGEHIRRLAGRGISPGRMAGAACHRLAAEIDENPASPIVEEMLEQCVPAVLPGAGGTLFAGLACTHYAYVRDVFRNVLARRTSRSIEILDPNSRLAGSVAAFLCEREAPDRGPASPGRAVSVSVVSKVELGEAKRRAIAGKIEPVSPASARALLGYTWTPGLF